MVCEFGMSEKLGPLSFGQRDEQIFLGREIATHKDFSEQTAVLIDEEVRKVVETAWAAASDIMRTHVDKLHALAESLLENETLDSDDIDRLLGPRPHEALAAADDSPELDASELSVDAPPLDAGAEA